MKVLVILEDPTLDQYIVKPIVERVFADLGRAARVDVLWDPHLRGSDAALDSETLAEIVMDYPMIDVFVLVVDRDCDRQGHVAKVAAREAELGGKLIGCLACEEVEVWLLALLDRPPARWNEIRAECDPKERFAEPFLASRGWATDVGRGRKRAMDALAGNYLRLLSRCDEVRALRDRIEEKLRRPSG